MANRLGICKDCSKVIRWETSKNGKEHPRNEDGKTHGCRMKRMGEKKLGKTFQRQTVVSGMEYDGTKLYRTFLTGFRTEYSYFIPSSVNV